VVEREQKRSNAGDQPTALQKDREAALQNAAEQEFLGGRAAERIENQRGPLAGGATAIPPPSPLSPPRWFPPGRRICHAKKPACGVCPVADLCPSYGAGETNEQAARKLMKYEMAPGREDLHLRFLQGATRRELMAEGYPLSA